MNREYIDYIGKLIDLAQLNDILCLTSRAFNEFSAEVLESLEKQIPRKVDKEITEIGDLSDGYHTFNELYHHRAILFSVICNNNKEIAWKSRSHHDGSMYSNMFIVGINTPKGQATYHYDVNPYWGMFDVQELEFAPEWDGHTPDQAIERINTLSKLGRGRL